MNVFMEISVMMLTLARFTNTEERERIEGEIKVVIIFIAL